MTYNLQTILEENDNIRVIALDFDNTLVFTGPVHKKCYQKAMASLDLGHKYIDEIYDRYINLGFETVAKKLMYTSKETENIAKIKATIFSTQETFRVNSNLIAELFSIRRNNPNIIFALLTNASYATYKHVTSNISVNINELLDYIITRDDVTNKKPDVEMINTLISRIGRADITNNNIFYIGDDRVHDTAFINNSQIDGIIV